MSSKGVGDQRESFPGKGGLILSSSSKSSSSGDIRGNVASRLGLDKLAREKRELEWIKRATDGDRQTGTDRQTQTDRQTRAILLSCRGGAGASGMRKFSG